MAERGYTVTRRRGFASNLGQIQRDLARQQAARVRANAAAQREAERARKAYERATAADQKERQQLYLESRSASVDAMNEQLDAQITHWSLFLRRRSPATTLLISRV